MNNHKVYLVNGQFVTFCKEQSEIYLTDDVECICDINYDYYDGIFHLDEYKISEENLSASKVFPNIYYLNSDQSLKILIHIRDNKFKKLMG